MRFEKTSSWVQKYHNWPDWVHFSLKSDATQFAFDDLEWAPLTSLFSVDSSLALDLKIENDLGGLLIVLTPRVANSTTWRSNTHMDTSPCSERVTKLMWLAKTSPWMFLFTTNWWNFWVFLFFRSLLLMTDMSTRTPQESEQQTTSFSATRTAWVLNALRFLGNWG